jgi:hypothetical protein
MFRKSILLVFISLVIVLSACGAGKDAINVVSRESGSGTRGAFIELFGIEEKNSFGNKIDKTTVEAVVLSGTQQVMSYIAGDVNSIGYISLGSLNDTVKAVKIDGVEATVENIKNGKYKVARPFNIATKGELSDDKELLEQKEFTSTDWSPNCIFEFDNVYPAGTYFVTCHIASGVEPRLVPYTEVIEGRNIEAHLYDKTFAEYNQEKAQAGESSNLGAGYNMWINVLQGVGANAQNFVKKYNEAKAEDVTIHDQAKYDAVMNAVGDDLKAFIKNTSEEDIATQLANLNDALSESTSENPQTGDSGVMVLVAAFAIIALAVVVKRKVYSF